MRDRKRDAQVAQSEQTGQKSHKNEVVYDSSRSVWKVDTVQRRARVIDSVGCGGRLKW